MTTDNRAGARLGPPREGTTTMNDHDNITATEELDRVMTACIDDMMERIVDLGVDTDHGDLEISNDADGWIVRMMARDENGDTTDKELAHARITLVVT